VISSGNWRAGFSKAASRRNLPPLPRNPVQGEVVVEEVRGDQHASVGRDRQARRLPSSPDRLNRREGARVQDDDPAVLRSRQEVALTVVTTAYAHVQVSAPRVSNDGVHVGPHPAGGGNGPGGGVDAVHRSVEHVGVVERSLVGGRDDVTGGSRRTIEAIHHPVGFGIHDLDIARGEETDPQQSPSIGEIQSPRLSSHGYDLLHRPGPRVEHPDRVRPPVRHVHTIAAVIRRQNLGPLSTAGNAAAPSQTGQIVDVDPISLHLGDPQVTPVGHNQGFGKAQPPRLPLPGLHQPEVFKNRKTVSGTYLEEVDTSVAKERNHQALPGKKRDALGRTAGGELRHKFQWTAGDHQTFLELDRGSDSVEMQDSIPIPRSAQPDRFNGARNAVLTPSPVTGAGYEKTVAVQQHRLRRECPDPQHTVAGIRVSRRYGESDQEGGQDSDQDGERYDNRRGDA
jgi:hypothetical protein